MDLPPQIKFNGWLLRTTLGELEKDGVTSRLQEKPLLILCELLSRPGQLVTREQLIARLWPKGIVDFDTALNAAMRRLRVALQDDADTPRYIETIPRKGYRFIGSFEASETETIDTPPLRAPATSAETPVGSDSVAWYQRASMYATGGLIALVITGVAMVSIRHDRVEHAGQDRAASSPARQQAHQMVQQGLALLANGTGPDTEKANALFARATVLDPTFAPSYSGAGFASLNLAAIRHDWTTVCINAGKSFDRALQLDAELGDAWIGRAVCTEDPAMAEQFFRAGLRLAPNNPEGYVSFAQFLFFRNRRGEAIDVLDEALRDALRSPALLQTKAFYVMVVRNDLAEHDRLLHEALEANPHFYPALFQLAEYTYFFRGQFAESINLIERAVAANPQLDEARSLAALMYLDVDDPDAAARVLGDSGTAYEGRVALAQYRRDPQEAAQVARQAETQWWRWTHHSLSPLAEAMRDQAAVGDDPTGALKVLDSVNSNWSWPPMAYRGFTLIYAHALALVGRADKARELANAFLDLSDAEALGRPAHWFGRERAEALAVLGRDNEALAELIESQKIQHWVRWWYLAELDPLYRNLRQDPRFQQLAVNAKQHRMAERARLDQMRRAGEVPIRQAS